VSHDEAVDPRREPSLAEVFAASGVPLDLFAIAIEIDSERVRPILRKGRQVTSAID
jgi:hypothetical protein